MHLMLASLRWRVPIISALGAGGKIDPASVITADISETHMDPMAEFVRKR
jgi:tRNA A37 threonylcarbamoyladenosine dehydratase